MMITTIEMLISEFSKIRRFYAGELQQILIEENLSPNEISILIFLSNNPSINTSSELVYFLEVSKGLISRSIDSLGKKGLINCVADDHDKRILRIRLSDESKKLVEKLQTETANINQRIFQDISPEDLACTETTIAKILHQLQVKESDKNETFNV